MTQRPPTPPRTFLEHVAEAHLHEVCAQVRLGLPSDRVRAAAPKELRNDQGRYVAGLRVLAEALRAAKPRRRTRGPERCILHLGEERLVAPQHQVLLAAEHIARADDAYWAAAHWAASSEADLLTPKRLSQLGGDPNTAAEAAVDALHMAARRYDPEKGQGRWRRHCISWLMNKARDRHVASFKGALTTHGYEVLKKAERCIAEAEARGQPVELDAIASRVGTSPDYLRQVLATKAPKSLDAALGQDGDADATTRGEVIEDEACTEAADHLEARLTVEALLKRLPAREAWVLARSHGLWETTPLTLTALASELGWPVLLAERLRGRALRRARGLTRTDAPLGPEGVELLQEALLAMEVGRIGEGPATRRREVRHLMASIAPRLVPALGLQEPLADAPPDTSPTRSSSTSNSSPPSRPRPTPPIAHHASA